MPQSVLVRVLCRAPADLSDLPPGIRVKQTLLFQVGGSRPPRPFLEIDMDGCVAVLLPGARAGVPGSSLYHGARAYLVYDDGKDTPVLGEDGNKVYVSYITFLIDVRVPAERAGTLRASLEAGAAQLRAELQAARAAQVGGGSRWPSACTSPANVLPRALPHPSHPPPALPPHMRRACAMLRQRLPAAARPPAAVHLPAHLPAAAHPLAAPHQPAAAAPPAASAPWCRCLSRTPASSIPRCRRAPSGSTSRHRGGSSW
jgi:hypothetical protein